MSDQHPADAAFEAWCEEQPSWPWRRTSTARFAFHAGQHARQPEVERLRDALTKIADESVFNQQRFAEDTDTDYFLRCFRAVKDAARKALEPPPMTDQATIDRLEAKLTGAITERVEAEEDRDRFQGAAERLEARVRELEATVQRYEAPGGWTFLREIEARRVLGDPMQGVSLTARGTFLEPPQ